METSASCGDCDSKEKQIGMLEDRIGKVLNERLKVQSIVKDVKKEGQVKGDQKREILKLKL